MRTVPVAEPLDAHRAPPTDPRRRTRWLAALLIPIGPAAVAVLRFVLPYSTVDDGRTIVNKVAAHPDAQSLVLWLGFLAVLTLVPGALWVGRLTRHRAPGLTATALVLLVPGYLALGWLIGSDLLLWGGVRAGFDTGSLTRLYEATHPTSAVAGGLFVLGHVIGTVLLGTAMWRSRTAPPWAAVLTGLSQPLHFVAAVIVVSHPLDLVAWGMQTVGFAAAAVAVARLRDDEWDLAPQVAAAPSAR